MPILQDTFLRQQSGGAYAWGVVLILMPAQTTSFIDRMIMGLLVGPIRASFEISDTQFSLLAGLAFAIFYSIMGVPLGRLADCTNRKKMISVAIAFWSLMTAMCGLAKGFGRSFYFALALASAKRPYPRPPTPSLPTISTKARSPGRSTFTRSASQSAPA